jgi:hypothetical protein
MFLLSGHILTKVPLGGTAYYLRERVGQLDREMEAEF